MIKSSGRGRVGEGRGRGLVGGGGSGRGGSREGWEVAGEWVGTGTWHCPAMPGTFVCQYTCV